MPEQNKKRAGFSWKALPVTVRKTIYFLLGFAGFAAVMLIRPAGLEGDGVTCLALGMMAVIWWATGAMPPGFSALLLMVGFVLLIDPGVAGPELVFRFWTTPTLYLALGGYLIAHAVEDCGLGRRISVHVVGRFVRTYRGCIICCYVLHLLLSILIPQPWPRSFLIMSVMRYIIRETGLQGKYAANISLAAFVGSIPTSMVLLTGDSVLNSLVGSMAGVQVSYQNWLLYMGLPGLVATALTCLIQLRLFGSPEEFSLDAQTMQEEAGRLGKMSLPERKVVAVLAVAVALWMTDSLTGIHPGWTALICASVLALPALGILDNEAWKKIPLGTLLFVSAAVALGAVGGATGMNAWLAGFLPAGTQGSLLSFAGIAVAFCMITHLCLGSTMTAMGVVGAAIVAFGTSLGVSPLLSALLVYCATALHWILPFHHMNILVGSGAEDGYTDLQVMKFGAAQTITVLLTCSFGLFWWSLLGL